MTSFAVVRKLVVRVGEPDLFEGQYPISTFAGIGNDQFIMNSLSVVCGGGIRIGLEDNIWYDQSRTKLATNSDLLTRMHDIATSHEREIMPSMEMRNLLKLLPGNGEYGRQTA